MASSRRTSVSSVKEVRKGKIEGDSFGTSTWTLYEVSSAAMRDDTPCLIVWLHGQDMGHISPSDLLGIQQRVRRRVFCLVPRNPEMAGRSVRFLWALGYTKAQNRNGLGFIYGKLRAEFLDTLCATIQGLAKEVHASHVILLGYSMGGFGVLQLGAHCPKLFDAAVAVAGHALGTVEPPDGGYQAPQPESTQIFREFVEESAANLASIPLVIAVHAKRDGVSHYHDMEAIVEAVNAYGGEARMHKVPDDMADSDYGGRKNRSRLGHSYYYYSLINETSEALIYSHLRKLMDLEQEPEAELPVKRARRALYDGLDLKGVLQLVRSRLSWEQTEEDKAAIRGIVEECGFGDCIELALRMLRPALLREVMADAHDITRKLAGEAEADTQMLWLISQLDTDVSDLAGRLQELDQEDSCG